MMALFESVPSQIEAIQWTGDNYAAVADFAGEVVAIDINLTPSRFELKAGKDGAQGWVKVPVGHWIVRQPGDLSDHWPVDPDYFAAKYRPAGGTAT